MRVVLVDDHPVYRHGLAMLLAEEGIEVAAAVGTAEEGLAAAVEHRPDVVVLDLHLPDGTGVQVMRRLATELPGAAVLVLTMDSSDQATLEALRAGARGYLLKEAAGADIGRAVAAVARGEMLVDARVAPRVAGLLTRPQPAGGRWPDLSARERQVLDLVAQGRSNAEIARALFLSQKTVRNHVSALLAKTASDTRPALIARARDHS